MSARPALLSGPLFSQVGSSSNAITTPAPDAGKMAILFVLNFFWSGLGNLAVGDKRGWGLGFFNWLVFALSCFTFFLPSLLYFGFCCYQGYEFLKMEPPAGEASSGTGLLKL